MKTFVYLPELQKLYNLKENSFFIIEVQDVCHTIQYLNKSNFARMRNFQGAELTHLTAKFHNVPVKVLKENFI